MSTYHVPAGDGTLHAWVRFGAKTHSVLPQHTAISEHTSGAMEEAVWEGSNASSHKLRCQNHEHARNSWSVKGAMDESSGQGQKASTRKKPSCHGYRSLQNEPLRWNRHRHHRPASQKVERVTFHRGDGWKFRERFKDASTQIALRCHGYCSLQSWPLRRNRRHRPASQKWSA